MDSLYSFNAVVIASLITTSDRLTLLTGVISVALTSRSTLLNSSLRSVTFEDFSIERMVEFAAFLDKNFFKFERGVNCPGGGDKLKMHFYL